MDGSNHADTECFGYKAQTFCESIRHTRQKTYMHTCIGAANNARSNVGTQQTMVTFIKNLNAKMANNKIFFVVVPSLKIYCKFLSSEHPATERSNMINKPPPTTH